MKTNSKITNSIFTSQLLVLLSIVVFLAACTGSKNANQNISYSDNALKLSRKMIKVYSQLDSIKGVQTYQAELLKILNDVSPETYIMKVNQGANSTGEKGVYKLNALRSFEKVFIAYNLQLDSKFTSKSSNLVEKLEGTCSALDSVNLNEQLKMKNEKIRYSLKNNKFNISEAIFELTDLYSEFWKEESQKWNLYLDENHKNITKGIESIPVASFNPEKIKQLVNDPYANSAVLVNLYKLNLIKENQQVTQKLKNEIQTINDAFGMISQVQGELIKRNRNEFKINDLNNAVGILLID